jgi:hypothetical protein
MMDIMLSVCMCARF